MNELNYFKLNGVTILFFFMIFGISQSSAQDFRKAKWGMEKYQVKQTENTNVIREEGKSLYYKGFISGIPATIVYNFIDNKLRRGLCLINQEVSQGSRGYFSIYQNLKKALILKYGAQAKENNVDNYKNNQKLFEEHIISGKINPSCFWSTPSSSICLGIGLNTNSVLTLFIIYMDNSSLDLLEKDSSNELLDGL